MSWRTCRRFGQALNETVAWTAGFLITAGIILFLDLGGVGMISTRPTDPGVAVAMIGGFVGMGFSRYLWKRRGGHLQPVNNRWTRAFGAMRVEDKPKQSAAKRSAAGKSPSTAAAAKPRAAAPTTKPTAQARSTSTSGSKTSSQKKTAQRNTTAYKWGRAIGAMLDTDQSKSSTRR
jgi:hypothetical protein